MWSEKRITNSSLKVSASMTCMRLDIGSKPGSFFSYDDMECMEWNLAFVLVSLVWSYFAAVQRLAIRGVGGNEVENLIAMIPGKNHVLLQAILFYVHFYLKAELQDDGIETAVYITSEEDVCTRTGE